MIKNLNELAKFVKGGADVLQKAIESEDNVSLDFIEGSFVSDTDLTTLKDGVFKEGKKEGNIIGYDHGIKDFKKEFGIDTEGKDKKVIADAIRNQIITDANIEPDKKVNELKSSLENLQQKYTTDLGAKDSEISNLSSNLNEFKINGDLNSHLPDNLNGIDSNDFMTLAKTTANFQYEEGKLVVKQGDNILKDKMEKPISPKDYLTDFAVSKNWINTSGRGGSDQGGGSNEYKSINDVYKHMESNNISPMSPDGQKLIEEFNNSLT